MSTAKLIRYADDLNDYALCLSARETRLLLYFIVGNATREQLMGHMLESNPEVTLTEIKDMLDAVDEMFKSIKEFNNVYDEEVVVEEPLKITWASTTSTFTVTS